MPKVLSLLQPWASLVVMGLKTIETRSWTTSYRGRLLIHAGKRRAGAALAHAPRILQHIPEFAALPFGAIIGEVTLVDVLRAEEIGLTAADLNARTMEEDAFGPLHAGRFAWMLEDAIEWPEPISARGHLGLWEI